jgi:hypothetical protein
VNALGVVRRLVEADEGADLVPVVREVVERWQNADARGREQLARDEVVLSLLAPDIEIRVHVFDLDVDTFRGRDGWIEFWRRWLEIWETYTYEVAELRDLGGGTTLAQMHLHARGRAGIPVEGTTFELYGVRDGLVASWQGFPSEQAALDAAQCR